MPIAPCCVLLALRFLDYLIKLPSSQIASKALKESHLLCLTNRISWLSDLDYALQIVSNCTLSLPPLSQLNSDKICMLSASLTNYVWTFLELKIHQNRCLYLFHRCLEPFANGSFFHIHSMLCHYLIQVTVPAHCKSLTNLLFGESIFYTISHYGVSDDGRQCRMCHMHVESPEHAILQCASNL